MTADDWVKISCAEADEIRHGDDVKPAVARTDLYGQYGEPEVFTEWWDADEQPVLKEHRYPSGEEDDCPDRKPCEHYRWEGERVETCDGCAHRAPRDELHECANSIPVHRGPWHCDDCRPDCGPCRDEDAREANEERYGRAYRAGGR